MEKNKKRVGKGMKVVGIVAGIVVLFFVFIGLYLLWELKEYTDRVPKITPKENVTVKAGQTLFVEDMFEIECKGAYVMKLHIGETDISDAVVSEDKKQLYVGSKAGTIRVVVDGSGEVAEYVDGETVITVLEE